MMRGFVFGLAVLALTAGSAFGQVSHAFSLDGGGADPNAVIDIADVVDGTLTVDVYLRSDQNMRAAGVVFDGSNEISYDAAATVFYGLAVGNYADVDGTPPVNSSGWSAGPSDSSLWAAGNLPMPSGDALEMGTIAADLVAGAQPGFLGQIVFHLPASELTYPTVITSSGYAGDLNGDAMEVTGGTITITPEPASLVLLLGALPLLRRRR